MSEDLSGLSKVKADDMDEIGQSGAANLLRMNVAEIERLTAENERVVHHNADLAALGSGYKARVEKLEVVLRDIRDQPGNARDCRRLAAQALAATEQECEHVWSNVVRPLSEKPNRCTLCGATEQGESDE